MSTTNEPVVRVERKVQWRVEWKCDRHPNQFKPYSTFKNYPSEVLYSFERCLQAPGCIEARIVQRFITTETVDEVIDPAGLQGRI